MPQSNVESDPMFQLVTDALRAGPGSAEWHQAVARLRDGGGPTGAHADDYRLLIDAREHIEAGKDWRAVRAGPGFTRKLLERIDAEEKGAGGNKSPGLPTATLIALGSALVILGVLAYVGWQIMPRGDDRRPATVEDLRNAYFPTELAAATFEGAQAAVPPNWRQVGGLPLEAAKVGLRPAATAGEAGKGGAVVAPEPVAPDEPFAAEVRLQLGKPSDDVIVEVFVSASPDFSPDKATSASELVWSLRGARQQVILGAASVQADAARPEPEKVAAGEKPAGVPVRILVNRDAAIVESNGQQLWAGAHGLPTTPRHVGVRFLRAGPAKGQEPAVVQSVRVLRK